jgi:hypothetical protein
MSNTKVNNFLMMTSLSTDNVTVRSHGRWTTKYIALIGRMINAEVERMLKRAIVDRSRYYPVLAWRNWEKPRKLRSGQPTFEPRTSRKHAALASTVILGFWLRGTHNQLYCKSHEWRDTLVPSSSLQWHVLL